MSSGFTGQVGQESRLRLAVLETQCGVSGGVGRHRHMPICPVRYLGSESVVTEP
jgi:hypothetical protein